MVFDKTEDSMGELNPHETPVELVFAIANAIAVEEAITIAFFFF